jgi:transcriptional regulator
MPQEKPEILPGTLDLMVLKTLAVLGPLHGFGLARRIEQISASLMELNQGTIYASLLRLQQHGWISSAWGVSENNRKAKFYSITKAGQKKLAAETRSWERTSDMMTRVLALEPEN